MRRVILFGLLILIISNISALCEEGQININNANAEELDEIIWVGPATAEKIINARPFDSVDDLVKVSGIAEAKLEDIKDQGLACVDEQIEKNKDNEKEEEEKETKKESDKEDDEEEDEKDEEEEKEDTRDEDETSSEKVIKITAKETKMVEAETINLSPKNIKSEENTEGLDKKDYATYGLGFFCILLAFLFIIRKSKFEKNEFN